MILNHVPVIFAMDRAGFVGDDGAVHHGFLDQAFLRPLPDIVLMAPSDEAELGRCLSFSLTLDTASALRYPRDNVPACNYEDVIEPALRADAKRKWTIGRSRVLRNGQHATIIAYGALAASAMLAAEELSSEGIDVQVIDARFCKPIDGELLSRVLRAGVPVLTLEDHALQNGFGTAVLEHARSHQLPVDTLTCLGMPDRLIAHATRGQQLTEIGLDAVGVARSVRDAIRAASGSLQHV